MNQGTLTARRSLRASRHTLVLSLLLSALLLLGLAAVRTSAASAAQCSAADDFSAAAAPPIFPSCFEGADGDMQAQGPSPKAIDWQQLVGAPGTIVTQDGTGGTDDTFQGGSKEEVPGGWTFTQSPSSPKDDVLFAAQRTDSLSNDVFLYLGSILKAANGSFDESFELNQLSPGTVASPTYRTATVGGTTIPVPARETGDLLLTFDTNGGIVTIGLCTWKSAQPDPAPGNPFPAGYFDSGQWLLLDGTPLDNTNTKACTQLNPQTTPAAEGAVNASTIPAAQNPISNTDVTAGNFGELAVNITAALKSQQTPNPCFDFGSVWMRTRSSNQVNSNPEDVVFPKPIVVANCAVSGTKFGDVNGNGIRDGGEPGLPNWRIYVDLNNNGVRDAGEPFADTDATGAYTIANVPSGTHTVREEGIVSGGTVTPLAQTGYTCTAPNPCSYSVAVTGGVAGGNDFGNYRPASVTIVKQTTPSTAAQTFPFKADVTGLTPANNLTDFGNASGTFSLNGAGVGSSKTFSVHPGTYTVAEGTTAGWAASGLSCTGDANSSGNPATGVSTLDLSPGDSVTCTYQNVKLATLSVTKTEAGGALTRSWDFRLTGPNSFTQTLTLSAATPTVTFGPVPAGTYTLCELNVPAGWFSAIGPVDGSGNACEDIVLAAGATQSITIDNVHPGIAVDKKEKVDGSGGAFVDGPIQTHVGETIDYEMIVTNTGNEPLKVSLTDVKCDGTPAPPSGVNPATDTLAAGASWTFTCSHVIVAADGASYTNTVSVTGTDAGQHQVGPATDSVVANVLDPQVAVVKTGAAFAYHGDTVTFSYTVTNPGNAPLSDVHVTDDKCSPVSTNPVSKVNDNGNSTLDHVGQDGVTLEKWVFTCSMVIPPHTAGEENPIVNTATVTAKDPTGKQVTAHATHSTLILHPAVAIAKSGPATALAGSAVLYTLAVTNPGDESLPAPFVGVSDPLCQAPPALQAKQRGGAADPTPDTLDPGDTWLYTCTVQTTPSQTEINNTAHVTAQDPHGKVVQADAAAKTTLTKPAVIVAPAVVAPALPVSAKLIGPVSCAARAFKTRIKGTNIASVKFYIDGKRVKTLKKPNSGKDFTLPVSPSRYGKGVHHLKAVITFVAGAKTKPRTLQLTFQQCPRKVAPAFTG
jgi:uncharacterized repeat protein (TIGR01451 family)